MSLYSRARVTCARIPVGKRKADRRIDVSVGRRNWFFASAGCVWLRRQRRPVVRKHGFHRRRCVGCNAGRDVLPTNRLDRFTRLAKIGCVEIEVSAFAVFQTKQIYTLDLFLGDLGLEPFDAFAEVFRDVGGVQVIPLSGIKQFTDFLVDLPLGWQRFAPSLSMSKRYHWRRSPKDLPPSPARPTVEQLDGSEGAIVRKRTVRNENTDGIPTI